METKDPEILLKEVQKIAPQLADVREVAAMIESFGYTDRSMKDWGFPDVFALAQHIFDRFPPYIAPKEEEKKESALAKIGTELTIALRKCSLSLAYAVPWMALLALQYRYPDALQVSPGLGGALSLSLIASLITSGGFIQMISRSGNLYYGLDEPFLARRSCVSLLVLGGFCTVIFAVFGILTGLYFQVFALPYLTLAAVNYIGLSFLWMFCAVISVQGFGWCIPIIFLVSGVAVAALRFVFHLGTTTLLMLWPPLALACALACAISIFRYFEKKKPGAKDSARPRFSVTFISLVPFYAYGTVYFSFMFADRLTAGSAIPWVSGLSFGIDSAYTKGMDLVLLAFLITAALVEYFSDSFLKFWNDLAKTLPQSQTPVLVSKLAHRHIAAIINICAVFGAMSIFSWLVFSRAFGLVLSASLLQTVLFGGVGYLMLSLALLENIILSSLNANSLALRAVSIGLAVNLLAGYALSHWLGVQYAAVGLFLGSAVVLYYGNLSVRQALRHPDYHYSIA
jgi:hypothetical protein